MSVIINLGNAANTATISYVDTLTSGAGADTIALSGAVSSASFDLGGGNDTLTFGNFTNSATVGNVKTITGGTGNDSITLATALNTGMAVDLGMGTNKLTMANLANTGTVSNVNTLVGGTGVDAITLATAVSNGSVDLGAGNDTLTFAMLHESDVTVDARTCEMRYHTNYAEPWRVTLVDTGLETMTGGRLRRIRRYLTPGESFCMTYGDGVADIDIGALIEFHHRHGKLATITAVVPPGRYGALLLENDIVTRFSEKPPGDNALINGGFFVLQPDVLDRIAGDTTPWETEPLESLARDGELHAYRHGGFWQPMDTLRDETTLETLWSSGQAPWKMWDELPSVTAPTPA